MLLSGGLRRRFGLRTSRLDELAGWGLVHAEDQPRLISALEAVGRDGETAVERSLRILVGIGVWAEYDCVLAKLDCGGMFGERSGPCSLCGGVHFWLHERRPEEWVDEAVLMEGRGREPKGDEGELEEVAKVAAPAPSREETEAAQRALAESWARCEELHRRARWLRMTSRTRVEWDGFAAVGADGEEGQEPSVGLWLLAFLATLVMSVLLVVGLMFGRDW